MDDKIKLYVISGFLGSGKSTFLKNLLIHLTDEKVGITVNEFGRITQEGNVYRKNGVSFVENKTGSVFCSCKKSDLTKAMEEMAGHHLKYVFIEGNGFEDPSELFRILGRIESDIGALYEYAGAICIVDGLYFTDQLENYRMIEKQLNQCHFAVVNKIDLIGKKTLERIKAKLLEINPGLQIKEAQFGKFDYSFLNENLLKNYVDDCEDFNIAPESKPFMITLHFTGRVKKADLTKFLTEISTHCYRIKGFCMLEDGWNKVDIVQEIIEYKPSAIEENVSNLIFASKIGNVIVGKIQDAWNKILSKEMRLSV
ncbi:MAG: GTP-binding protein [Clostridiaceae bacterium]